MFIYKIIASFTWELGDRLDVNLYSIFNSFRKKNRKVKTRMGELCNRFFNHSNEKPLRSDRWIIDDVLEHPTRKHYNEWMHAYRRSSIKGNYQGERIMNGCSGGDGREDIS